MGKTITIGGQDVPVIATASTPVIYRQVFHEDLLVFLQEMEKATRANTVKDGTSDMLCKLAYIMNQQTEKTQIECFRELSIETWLQWLDNFKPLDFEMAGGDIINTYYDAQRTQSTSKNQ